MAMAKFRAMPPLALWKESRGHLGNSSIAAAVQFSRKASSSRGLLVSADWNDNSGKPIEKLSTYVVLQAYLRI